MNWSGELPGHQEFCKLPVEFQGAAEAEDHWVRRQGSETSEPGPVMEEAECDRPGSQAVLLCGCSVVSNSLAAPWTVAQQAPLSVGFSRQEYWSGLPFPSPGDLPDPGI